MPGAVTRGPVVREALRFIVSRLRERDRAELFATRWDDDEAGFTESIFAVCGAMSWCWSWAGVPVSVMGACPLWPGVWSVWAFGTDDWPRVVLSMTKHARRYMMPALVKSGAHRAQCCALAKHEDARRWLSGALHARQESILPAYGRGKEDFVLYVWTPADVHPPR